MTADTAAAELAAKAKWAAKEAKWAAEEAAAELAAKAEIDDETTKETL